MKLSKNLVGYAVAILIVFLFLIFLFQDERLLFLSISDRLDVYGSDESSFINDYEILFKSDFNFGPIIFLPSKFVTIGFLSSISSLINPDFSLLVLTILKFSIICFINISTFKQLKNDFIMNYKIKILVWLVLFSPSILVYTPTLLRDDLIAVSSVNIFVNLNHKFLNDENLLKFNFHSAVLLISCILIYYARPELIIILFSIFTLYKVLSFLYSFLFIRSRRLIISKKKLRDICLIIIITTLLINLFSGTLLRGLLLSGVSFLDQISPLNIISALKNLYFSPLPSNLSYISRQSFYHSPVAFFFFFETIISSLLLLLTCIYVYTGSYKRFKAKRLLLINFIIFPLCIVFLASSNSFFVDGDYLGIRQLSSIRMISQLGNILFLFTSIKRKNNIKSFIQNTTTKKDN